MAHGKTSPETALILAAAPNTIKKHVQNILVKLGVETRLAAALQAQMALHLLRCRRCRRYLSMGAN